MKFGSFNFIKGLFIGVAFVIPGLSGSMFAVVVGLYDKILSSVATFREKPLKNMLFLLPIAIGCVIGIIFSAKAVMWLYGMFRWQTILFFIGLMAGCLPLVLKKTKSASFNYLSCIICFISIIAITIFLNPKPDNYKEIISMTSLTSISDFLLLFVVGLVCCSLMAIPGISGSVILILLLQYGTVYNSLSTMSDFIILFIRGCFDEAFVLFPTILVIIPFGLGAVIGLVFISKLLHFAMSRYSTIVYCGVIGIVAGSAISILYNERPYFSGFSPATIATGLACLFAGAVATYFIEVKE